MGTMASGFNISKRSTNTHSSYSNCRLMDYWWKEMSGRIFHPSLKTFRIGCLCQCSNFQQPSDSLWTNGCHDSRLYHQVLFFLLIALTYSSLKGISDNIFIFQSSANSLPTSTLKLTVGIIFWEGVVFWFWAFGLAKLSGHFTIWIGVWSRFH